MCSLQLLDAFDFMPNITDFRLPSYACYAFFCLCGGLIGELLLGLFFSLLLFGLDDLHYDIFVEFLLFVVPRAATIWLFTRHFIFFWALVSWMLGLATWCACVKYVVFLSYLLFLWVVFRFDWLILDFFQVWVVGFLLVDVGLYLWFLYI